VLQLGRIRDGTLTNRHGELFGQPRVGGRTDDIIERGKVRDLAPLEQREVLRMGVCIAD
jgi:hypothetical protein